MLAPSIRIAVAEFASKRAFFAFPLRWQEVSEVTLPSPAAGVWAAGGSSPWVGTRTGVLSPGRPWKALVGDVIPDGSRPNTGRRGGGGEWWRCSVLLFSSTVSASWCGNRTEDGPERAAFSCSTHSKPNCYLLLQLSFFFMAPLVKDKVCCKIRGIPQCLFQSCKRFEMLWDTCLMKSQLQ